MIIVDGIIQNIWWYENVEILEEKKRNRLTYYNEYQYTSLFSIS